ncbi:hypothetical protein QYF36_023487 [Acer negundo]|nr:hypothetical protein QYF36_023487 [Acer negundo]
MHLKKVMWSESPWVATATKQQTRPESDTATMTTLRGLVNLQQIKSTGRSPLTISVKKIRYLLMEIANLYPKNEKASPLSVLLRKKHNIGKMADRFQTLISEHNLEGFIVGYPFNKNRTTTDGAQVKLFIDELCNTGKLKGLKYTYWDEGFTSKIVELLLKNLNLPQVMSKTINDKFAAAGILQGYLDKANKKMKLEGTMERDYDCRVGLL